MIKKTILDNNIQYYKNHILTKLNHYFSWGLFSLYLYHISSSENVNKVSDKQLQQAVYIERFICDTDLLDDYMDKDNPSFNQLSHKKEFISEFLRCDLMHIYDLLNTNIMKKNIFTYNLSLSFAAQVSDITNKLTTESQPQDYFTKGIYRSVYLMNAIVQISVEKNSKHLFPFSFYYATSSQIENDVQNLLDNIDSDLTSTKATLPILVAYKNAQLAKNTPIIKHFTNLIERKDLSVIPEIKQYIFENGIIEYCRWLALNCKCEAKHHLDISFPQSKQLISEWFQLY